MPHLLLALLALLLAAPAAAQPPPGGRNHIPAELLAESDAPAPGQTVTIAFAFRPEQGWHGYWQNPGDAGAAARIEWTLPPGVTVDAPRYPTPRRLVIAELMNYVYDGPHALLASLRVPAGLAPGTPLPLRARIDYLACTDEICVPQQASLALDLRVGDGAIAAGRRTRFDLWRAALPRPLGAEGQFEVRGDRLRVAVALPASASLTEAYLFPVTTRALDYAADQAISRAGDTLIVETSAGADAATLARFDGLLAMGGGQSFAFNARPGLVPTAGNPIAVLAPNGDAGTAAEVEGARGPAAPSLLLALLGAVLGGLVLNVMPCVFPILSLKALSLARAGGSETEARREALAYAAGVIATCVALGAVLLALRAGGASVGWAFQLQDPRVVVALLLLTVAIALNLAGLYRLPGLSVDTQGGTLGAFATGALAAFIATPCTGPFMAAALGATLVLPAVGALVVFGGLGIGLALPFLLLAFIPALRRLLPRPGPWMERLQRVLSIPMFATALALAWVLGRQTGIDGMTGALAAALALGVALWWLGAHSSLRHRAPALALLAAAIIAPLVLLRGSAEPTQTAGTTALGAEPFSEARLAALQREGAPVFVYFTADWCVTCKANERGALASAAVAQAFRAGDVQVLVGDWTVGDAAIGRFLERHGRAGVPLYLWYAPGREAQVLPQLLTSGMLTGLVQPSSPPI